MSEKTMKNLKGAEREKLVGAVIRGLIRLSAPKLREAVESVVDGGKIEVSDVTGILRTQLHELEKASPLTPKDLPEILRAASRGTLTAEDERTILALRKKGAAYAQLATEFACNQVVIHALFKSKGLTEGRPEGGEKKPAKKAAPKPKGEKKARAKKAASGRQKKAEPSTAEPAPASGEKKQGDNW